MNNSFQKNAGFCLVIGSIFMVVMMVLHPTGGDVAHLMKMHDMAIIAHSLAIFTLPFVLFGFYGLSILLLKENKISMLAFIFASFALVAGMIAATINGLVLPMFVENYFNDFEQNSNVMKPILKYGSYFNKAMDYIMVVGIIMSINIWSSLMIRDTSKYLKWVGYYGIVLFSVALLGVFAKFNFSNLFGFRVFIFSLVSWIILVGRYMIKEK